MRILLASILFLIACLSSIQAELPTDEGPESRKQFSKSVLQLVKDKQFKVIEEMHDHLLKNNVRFKEGLWKLAAFYDGLALPYGNISDDEWESWIHLLNEWNQEYPDSALYEIAKAGSYINYAWNARGTGWGSTVTDEGKVLYRNRIEKAREILKQSQERQDSSAGLIPIFKSLSKKIPLMPNKISQTQMAPGWYAGMFTVALAQSWDSNEAEDLFRTATKFYPEYYGFYFSRANYLLPRWHGKKGELQDFIKTVSKNNGKELYARMYWSVDRKADDQNVFTHFGAEWNLFKEGFEEIERKYPDSIWNLSNYCRFACQADDKETAKVLFKRLNGLYWAEAWPSRASYDTYLKWANE